MKYFITTIVLLSCFFASGQLFIERATELGIDYEFDGTDYQEIGAGITIIDVNNDGWDDVFQSGGIFPSKIWLNQKGKFIDATKTYLPDSISQMFIQGAASADFNNDGYEDLFLCNLGEAYNMGDHQKPVLLINRQGKFYEPVFQATFNEMGNYSGCAWGDYNNDGFIDLFVLNYVNKMNKTKEYKGGPISYEPQCLENKFYINLAGKGFREIGKELKLNDSGCGLAASFTDYDNDGDMDLMMLNDFGSYNHIGNRIYRNDYPINEFSDVSHQLGFYNEFYGMGIGTGDVNNDGLLDYYLTNIGKNYFYQNTQGKFIERAKELGIDNPYARDTTKGTSWSGIFIDVENDGDLDLYVSKGYLESVEKVSKLDENKLFINELNSSFEDVSKSSGLNDSLAHRGSASFDFDHDGDLDIVSGVIKMRRGDFAGLDQKISLFENLNRSKNKWIGIKLIGTSTVNKQAIGSSVSFPFNDGIQIREVDGGSAHSSQSSKILYFGLRKMKFVRNIEIQWVGGKVTKIEKLKSGKCYSIDMNGAISIIY